MFLLFPESTKRAAFLNCNLHSIMFLLFLLPYLQNQRFHQFTFHYVSIISEQEVQSGAGHRNLHSIMFLLFRKPWRVITFPPTLFTFHYVSIISFLPPFFALLLWPIYIPLCFYYFLISCAMMMLSF